MIQREVINKARTIQGEADRLGFIAPPLGPNQEVSPLDLMAIYDALVRYEELRATTRKLFSDGHYDEAVEEAYKCINNAVKRKAGTDRDGPDLMHFAFNESNPALKLNSQRTQSQRDEQAGYRFIFAGCIIGIRNPRAHGHDLKDEPLRTLEMLAWANHLMRVVTSATRARRRSASTSP